MNLVSGSIPLGSTILPEFCDDQRLTTVPR